jgi:hypothetical protein
MMTADMKDVTHITPQNKENHNTVNSISTRDDTQKKLISVSKDRRFLPFSVHLPDFLPSFFLTESSIQYIAVVWVITPHSLIGTTKVPHYVLS